MLSLYSIQGFASSCPDGSEPIKSVSDDGTYFVFSCGTTDLTKKQGAGLNCGTNLSAVIPEQWTCFESPLMDLEIPKDWKLIDNYDRYQEIISLNAAPRLIGYRSNPPRDKCRHLLNNFEGNAGIKRKAGFNSESLTLNDCLSDLKARLYEGDKDYVLDIFEYWADNDLLKQPKDREPGSKDYDWFKTLGYISGIYAQEKDNIEFSDTFKAWLTDRLLNAEFRSFGHTRIFYRCKEILYNYKSPEWINDCSTPRFIMTEAWLVGGLALNNKEIFDEGIDSLQYITSLFNDENIHPWASRGIRMPSYYNQIPNWLSNYAVILDTVDYDFMEHEMPNGSKVHEAIKLAFDTLWSDDLSLFWPYIQLNLGTNFDQTFPELLKPLSERPKGASGVSGRPPKPQRVVRQALRYVDKYQPELKDRYGYEEVYSKNVTGTEDMNDVYNDKGWYYMYNLSSAFDTHSIYKASDKVFFSEENIEARRIAEEAARKAVEEEAARTAAFENKLAELAAQLEENLAAEVEACKTTPLNGEYVARWYLGDQNNNLELEFQGLETLNLENCSGVFEGKESFQPSKNLRKDLNITFEPNGSILIFGELDLFDKGDARKTELKGDINSGEISGIWGTGDLIKIQIESKKELDEKKRIEAEACKTTPLNGEYEARWIRDHWRDIGEWEFVGSEPLILDQCEGQFEGIKQFDPRPSPSVRKKLIVKYQSNGDISIKGDLNLYTIDDLRYTELYGNINDGEISGIWGVSDRLKIELIKK